MDTGTDMSEAEKLARLFHVTYERLAPQFGYETRQDTRAFDPESANGRLMIAVCESIITQMPPGLHELAEAVGREADSEVSARALAAAKEVLDRLTETFPPSREGVYHNITSDGKALAVTLFYNEMWYSFFLEGESLNDSVEEIVANIEHGMKIHLNGG